MKQEDNNLGLDPMIWEKFAAWLAGKGWQIYRTGCHQPIGTGTIRYSATRPSHEQDHSTITIKGNGIVERSDNGETMVTVFKKANGL
jgi:hypothetical protein